ncbi:MAG: SPOR domain-containing protein [Elainellaceae cyanobacterium]
MTYQPPLFKTFRQFFRSSDGLSSAGLWSSKRWAIAFGLLAVSVPATAQGAMAQSAMAQSTMAQSVIDGLPPPPSIPDLEPQPASPPDLAPDDAPDETPDETPDEINGESASPAPTDAAQQYRVLINSDSPFLLEQVRRIEPEAVFERYRGQPVILAGQFGQLAAAQRQVEALSEQGIGAEIDVAPAVEAIAIEPAVGNEAPPTSVAPPPPAEGDGEFDQIGSSIGSASGAVLPPAELSAPLPTETAIADPASAPEPSPEVTAAQPNPEVTVAQQPAPVAAGSDFYIVVPGDADNLDRLQGRVALLGASPNAIAQRDQPLGPHLLIGPFASRQSATRWNRFLRDFGMDARVYYRR